MARVSIRMNFMIHFTSKSVFAKPFAIWQIKILLLENAGFAANFVGHFQLFWQSFDNSADITPVIPLLLWPFNIGKNAAAQVTSVS